MGEPLSLVFTNWSSFDLDIGVLSLDGVSLVTISWPPSAVSRPPADDLSVSTILFGLVAAKCAFSLLLTGVAGSSLRLGVAGGDSAFFFCTLEPYSGGDFSPVDRLPVPRPPPLLLAAPPLLSSLGLVWLLPLGLLTAAQVLRLVIGLGLLVGVVVVDALPDVVPLGVVGVVVDDCEGFSKDLLPISEPLSSSTEVCLSVGLAVCEREKEGGKRGREGEREGGREGREKRKEGREGGKEGDKEGGREERREGEHKIII